MGFNLKMDFEFIERKFIVELNLSFFYLCCCFAISTSFVGSNTKLNQYCYIKMLELYFVIIFSHCYCCYCCCLFTILTSLHKCLTKKNRKIYMKNFFYAVLRTYFLFFKCTWKLNFKFSTKNRK